MVLRLSHETRARQDDKRALRTGHAERTRIGKEAVVDPHQLSHYAKWDTTKDTCRGGCGGSPRLGRESNIATCKSAFTTRSRDRFHFFHVTQQIASSRTTV